jgi:hypothetical protein
MKGFHHEKGNEVINDKYPGLCQGYLPLFGVSYSVQALKKDVFKTL